MGDARRTRVLLVTRRGRPGLLGSYGRAFERLGVDTEYWDFEAALNQAVRFGPFGRRLNAFLPVDPWQARAGRELIRTALTKRPDAIFVCGVPQVVPGALAQVRASLPDVRLVFVWPDPLLNLLQYSIDALPLYDIVATYSERSVEPLRRLGAHDVRWVPFGVDPVLMPADVTITDKQRRQFSCDVGFVGNYRPERERAIVALLDAGVEVKVWGTRSWIQSAGDPKRAVRYWQRKPMYGTDFVRVAQCSRVFLNVIDDTNYPAANMRFFEALACRATSLVSPCPEVERLFPDDVAVIYFRSQSELVTKTRELLGDERRRKRLAEEGHRRALAAHTYEHRVRDILQALDIALPGRDGRLVE